MKSLTTFQFGWLVIFNFLYWAAAVVGDCDLADRPVADDDLKRWMANYLAISEFECRFSTYAITRNSRDWAELKKGSPQIDQRGNYKLSEFEFKFRTRPRLYFLDGFLVTSGEFGGIRPMLYSSDGTDHRTFSDENYSGLIHPEEPLDVHVYTNPYHFLSFDSDLEPVFLSGKIVRESELVYVAKVPARTIQIPGEPPANFTRTIRFHLSPENGYMPKRIEVYTEDGRLINLLEILDFEQTNGIWFPVRGKRAFNPGKMDYEDILEVQTGSLKINPGLDKRAYRFEFPEGSAYINKTSGEKVIGEEYRRREKLAIAAHELESQPQSISSWIWGAFIVVLGLLIAWCIYQRVNTAALLLLSVCCVGCDNVGSENSDTSTELTPSSLSATIAIEPSTA